MSLYVTFVHTRNAEHNRGIFSSNRGFGIRFYYNLVAERATAALPRRVRWSVPSKEGWLHSIFCFLPHAHTWPLSQQSHLLHRRSLCTPFSFFFFFLLSTFEKVDILQLKYYFFLTRLFRASSWKSCCFSLARVFLLSCEMLDDSYLTSVFFFNSFIYW